MPWAATCPDASSRRCVPTQAQGRPSSARNHERDGNDRGDDQGAPYQQKRWEYPIAYDVADRSVLLEAGPQIAVEQFDQIIPVLLIQRQIKTELCSYSLVDFG